MAERIVAHARIRLESLLRIYYLRHSYESYGGLLMAHLNHLSSETLVRLSQLRRASVEDSQERLEALRSTLVLCFKGIHDQSKVFYLAAIVCKVMRQQLSPEDRVLLDQHIAPNDGKVDNKAPNTDRPVISEYVVPIINLHDDPALARLASLAKQIARVSVASGPSWN